MCDLLAINIISIFVIISATLIYFMEKWKNEEKVLYDVMEFFEEEPILPKGKVAVSLLMRRPIDLPIWFRHHRRLGVSHFFIRLEDSPGWDDYLASQNDVTFESSSSDKTGNNYETLMYRQVDFVNKSLEKAKHINIDWLFHIDSDELLHGSLAVLDELDGNFKVVRLDNAEAVFSENEDTCFSAVKFLKCSNSAPCRSYINGKSGGRVENGVELIGPHHFGYHGAISGQNIYNIPFEKLHVLHFDSCSFGAWAEKFKHLSQKKKDNIPFPYYQESMDAALQAFDVYKKYNMKSLDDIPNDQVYELTTQQHLPSRLVHIG